MAIKYQIGTTFQRRRRDYVETVVDTHTTSDSKGHEVKLRYITEHILLNQVVKDYDVVAATIDMGNPMSPEEPTFNSAKQVEVSDGL